MDNNMREEIEAQLTRLYCDQNYSGGNREWFVEENERKKYHAFVFTDGSFRERPKAIAGIGVFWGDGHPNNYSGLVHGEPCNNRAELCAAHHAIGQAFRDDYRAITIISDSTFVKNIIEHPERFESKKFDDLLVSIRIMKPFIKIKIFLVKGHAGNYGNEEADRLASLVTWSNTGSETLIRAQKELLEVRRIEISQKALLKKARIRRRTMYQLAEIRQDYDLVNSSPSQDVFARMGAPIGYLSRTSIRKFLTTNLPFNPNPLAFMEPSSMNQFPPPIEPVFNDVFSNMGPPIGADPFGVIDPFLNMGCLLNPGWSDQQQFQMWQYQSSMYAEEQRRSQRPPVAPNDDRRQITNQPTMQVRCQDPCCTIQRPPVPPMMMDPYAPRNPYVNNYSPLIGPLVSGSRPINNNVLRNSTNQPMQKAPSPPEKPRSLSHQLLSTMLVEEQRMVAENVRIHQMSSGPPVYAMQRPKAPVPPPCAPRNPGFNGNSPPMEHIVRSSTTQPMQRVQSPVGKPRISPVNSRVLSTMYVEEQRTMVEMRQMNSGPPDYAMQRPMAPVPPMTPCAPRNSGFNGNRLPIVHVVRNQPVQKAPSPPEKSKSSPNKVMDQPLPQAPAPQCAPRNQVLDGYRYPMRPAASSSTNQPMAPRRLRKSRISRVNQQVLSTMCIEEQRLVLQGPMPHSTMGLCTSRKQAPNGYNPPMAMRPVLNNRNTNQSNMNPVRHTGPPHVSPVYDQENQAPAGQWQPMRKSQEQRSHPFGKRAAMTNNKVPEVMSTMVVEEMRKSTSGPAAPNNNPPSSEDAVLSCPILSILNPVKNTVTTSTSTQNGAGPLVSTDDPSVHKSPAKVFHGFSVPNFMIFQRVFELTCVSFVDKTVKSETSVVEFD